MNNIKKITCFSVIAGMFLVAALATSAANRTAFAQNMSNQTIGNQTTSAMNQTTSAMNQTTSAMNQTSTNQTSAEPKFTTYKISEKPWNK